MKKLYYTEKKQDDNYRELVVYKDGKVLCELSCVGGFLTNGEEIQNWLEQDEFENSNEYEFEKFEFIIEDDQLFIDTHFSDKVTYAYSKEDRSQVNLFLFGIMLGCVDVYDDSDMYYVIDEEQGEVNDIDFERYNYIHINNTITYLDRLEVEPINE